MLNSTTSVKAESAESKLPHIEALERTAHRKLQPGEPGYGLGWKERTKLGV